jgi:hypothetical protein
MVGFQRAVSFKNTNHRWRPAVDGVSSASSVSSSSKSSYESRDAAVFPSPARSPSYPAPAMVSRMTMQQQQQSQWITTDSDCKLISCMHACLLNFNDQTILQILIRVC